MNIIRRILKWFGTLIAIILLIFIVALIIPEEETISTIQPRENTEYWELSEGFKIAYTHLKARDSSGKDPVIFLHGGPGGYVHSSITKTLERLTFIGHDVYLYDQRGSGLSDRLEKYSDVNFEKHLLDLSEIINEKINASKVILIGQSFGCIIISHFVARHPNLMSKIVMGSPGTFLPYKKSDGEYVNIDSLFSPPDTLDFLEPYDFIKDVDQMALKPKAMVATFGALLLDKKLISDEQMDRMLNTLASQFTKGMVCDPQNVLPEEGGGGLYAFIGTIVVTFRRSDIKSIKLSHLFLFCRANANIILLVLPMNMWIFFQIVNISL